jgi:hypothetical protein
MHSSSYRPSRKRLAEMIEATEKQVACYRDMVAAAERHQLGQKTHRVDEDYFVGGLRRAIVEFEAELVDMRAQMASAR